MNLEKLANRPYGAIVTNIDCATVTASVAADIRSALYRHQLLVFQGQSHLSPAEEVRFCRLIDRQAGSVWRDQQNNPWEKYKVEQGNVAGTFQIPAEPGVLVIGKGRIDHYGLKVTLGGKRSAYGAKDGSQVLGGGALQWHIDGAFYRHDPCRFTQMRCIEAPQGSGQWIVYGDGTGARLWCPAGSTAFASGRIAYDRLDFESRRLAVATRVHYLPKPFQSTYLLGNNQNGLRVIDPQAESRFQSGDEPEGGPAGDPDAKIYPLVWSCAVTSKLALMPHPRCVDHLEDTRTGTHLGKTRSRLEIERMMRPAIDPDQVYVHDWRPGDLLIWNNHSMWHSATGALGENDRRVQHLTAFNSIEPPA